jgi:hypothetical protein
MEHYIMIIVLMSGAGFLGGITNYLRFEQEKKDWAFFWRNVLMGISASALVPLFLTMISSNLLKESASDSSRFFIFFGFCLIASLSSKAFIQTVSDRLLNDLNKTKKELKEFKKDVQPIVSKETEPQEAERDASLLKISDFGLFDENSKKVLHALGRGNYVWRTLGGIVQETGIPTETVLNSLNWLSSKRLVEAGVKGRWGLTLKGRDFFSVVFKSESSTPK